MKNGVKDKVYYFLLDWKDRNLKEYQDIKGDKRLCDLSPYELNLLYRATKTDGTDDRYMSRTEAYQAMRSGHKVAHKNFMTHEFIEMKDTENILT